MQIEKHYQDGNKHIIFPDNTLKYILVDGSEETYFLDGSLQTIDKDGVITIEKKDGSKVIFYLYRKHNTLIKMSYNY
jgi:hypothetical protein